MKKKYIFKKQTQELYKIYPIKTEIRSLQEFLESRAGQGINDFLYFTYYHIYYI